MTEQQRKEMEFLIDTLKGEINRMCVTNELSELDSMGLHAKKNIEKLRDLRYDADFKKRRKKGFWIFGCGYGDGSDWYCSECGHRMRIKNTWNCPTVIKCDICEAEMLIPDDIEHEYENFVD